MKQIPRRRQQTQIRDRAGKGRDSPLAMRQIGGRAGRGRDEGGGNWEPMSARLGRLSPLREKQKKKISQQPMLSHSHVPRRGAPIAPTIPPSAFDFCPTYPSLTLPGAPRGHRFEVHGTKICGPHDAAHFVPFRSALRIRPVYLCPGFRLVPFSFAPDRKGRSSRASGRKFPKYSPAQSCPTWHLATFWTRNWRAG